MPTHAQQVTIGEVEFVAETSVMFKGTFDADKVCRTTLHVPDRALAEKIAKILTQNKGKNLLSIREVEIPEG